MSESDIDLKQGGRGVLNKAVSDETPAEAVRDLSGWNTATRADVLALYRLALGRAPESEEKFETHLSAAPTLPLLRERLFSSAEFLRLNWQVLSRETIGRAYRASPSAIETEVPDDKLERLFRHVEDVWTSLGKAEPHYSVLSTGKYKPENIRENEIEFYASGAAEWRFMCRRFAALELPINWSGTAIELGCGVGRVSRHLAPSFHQFLGYDISAPHLEFAREYLRQQNIIGARLEQLNSLSDIALPSHDFFYSRIVLQHNPPPVQKFLLNSALKSLRPDGVALFQLVTSIEGYSFRIDEYLDKMRSITDQELHALPQKDVFDVVHTNGCVPIDVARDVSITGFDKVSTVFIVRKQGI